MGELRGMTAQIQRELETTRDELRRGIVELPQETQETTANMRRVVADQIKALNELATLVSRSNRVVDAAPAVPAAPGQRAPRRRPPRRPRNPGLRPLPPQRKIWDRACEPRRRRHARFSAGVPLHDGGSAGGGPVQSSHTGSAAAVPGARYEPPARSSGPSRAAAPERHAGRREDGPAPREAGTRGGWLSDLLNRASRDDEPGRRRARDRSGRTGRSAKGLESLDSISVDIARMIDHDAAVELWDRYKSGERNVFTRRLYTLSGPADLRGNSPQVPARSGVQADGRPLRRRVRAAARGGLPRRPRLEAQDDLPDLGDRQGLHHAGACERTVRLTGACFRRAPRAEDG